MSAGAHARVLPMVAAAWLGAEVAVWLGWPLWAMLGSAMVCGAACDLARTYVRYLVRRARSRRRSRRLYRRRAL